MITVPEITEIIIQRSRYLSEALSKDLINSSSLARYIKPEIEKILLKKVSLSSVIMAIRRLPKKSLPNVNPTKIFNKKPSIILSSEVSKKPGLSSISISLPKEARHTPGVLYFLIKSIAWESINIEDISFDDDRLMLIFKEKDAQRAYSILISLFEGKII